MFLNCGVREDSWESLGLQGDPTNYPKGDQSWVVSGRTDVEAETPVVAPPGAKADSFEKTLMLGKIEGTDSMDMNLGKLRHWWWTGRPGVLQFMGLQRVRHDWATEQKCHLKM